MVFSAIPLISVVAFLPTIFYASSLTECLLSCLGILSLLATAYTMRHSPLQPDRKGKKPSSAEDQRLVLVRTALVPANGVVCLALTAAYFLAGANPSYTTRPMLFLIPGGKYFVFKPIVDAFPFARIGLCQPYLTSLSYSYTRGHFDRARDYAFSRSFSPKGPSVRVQGSIVPSVGSSLQLPSFIMALPGMYAFINRKRWQR